MNSVLARLLHSAPSGQRPARLGVLYEGRAHRDEPSKTHGRSFMKLRTIPTIAARMVYIKTSSGNPAPWGGVFHFLSVGMRISRD